MTFIDVNDLELTNVAFPNLCESGALRPESNRRSCVAGRHGAVVRISRFVDDILAGWVFVNCSEDDAITASKKIAGVNCDGANSQPHENRNSPEIT